MYNNICIIGIGTLGGFLAKNLSDLDFVKKLVLFDFDTVENENTKNSVYTEEDIGKLKTDAILNKLNPKILAVTYPEKFIEGYSNFPSCDLVIDCRDFVYDRKNIIDMRLYISLRNLIVDCRKNVKYDLHHEGKYLEKLNRFDANNAAFHVTLLVNKYNVVKELINSQLVHQIFLDYSTEMTKKLINENNNKSDVVYDRNSSERVLLNLHQSSKSILKANHSDELNIYLGSFNQPYLTKKVKQKEMTTINDIITVISQFLALVPKNYFNYYVISHKKIDNKHYIELIPETGAA